MLLFNTQLNNNYIHNSQNNKNFAHNIQPNIGSFMSFIRVHIIIIPISFPLHSYIIIYLVRDRIFVSRAIASKIDTDMHTNQSLWRYVIPFHVHDKLYPPDQFVILPGPSYLSFCHYYEHFIFYRLCSIRSWESWWSKYSSTFSLWVC